MNYNMSKIHELWTACANRVNALWQAAAGTMPGVGNVAPKCGPPNVAPAALVGRPYPFTCQARNGCT